MICIGTNGGWQCRFAELVVFGGGAVQRKASQCAAAVPRLASQPPLINWRAPREADRLNSPILTKFLIILIISYLRALVRLAHTK
jgi:hypothetical protein